MSIAGHAIRVHYLNSELESLLSKAFVQQPSTEHADPGLTIYVCDFDSMPAAYPVPPWKSDSQMEFGADVQRPMLHFRDERFVGLFEPRSSLLSLLDTESNLAVWCIPRRNQIPHYELSAPFRPIIHWWMGQQGLQIVHAGAVASENVAVLLVGRSGSGKSTTSLSSLGAGLRYLSDDYVLVEDLQSPVAWSLYRTAKLFQSDLESFPHLADTVGDISFANSDKAIMYLGPTHLSQADSGFPIGAILLPTVVDSGKTRLTEVSAATCLSAMAPSTMLQLRGSGHPDFERLGRLACRVPSYRLELGADRNAIQQTMLDLMGNLQK